MTVEEFRKMHWRRKRTHQVRTIVPQLLLSCTRQHGTLQHFRELGIILLPDFRVSRFSRCSPRNTVSGTAGCPVLTRIVSLCHCAGLGRAPEGLARQLKY